MSTTVKHYGLVVGIDGSAASDAAVVWAARDAALRNLPLTLVHMFETFVPTFPQIPLPSGVAEWQEDDGRKVHAHMLAPNIEFMVEQFERYFGKVEVVRYPPAFPGWAGRPAIIASDKKAR